MHLQSRIATVLVLLIAGFARAQNESASAGDRAADKSLSMARSTLTASHESLLKPMIAAAKMDEEQIKKTTALLRAADGEFRAARKLMTPDPEVTKRMNDTVGEIQAAKSAGDSKREKELVEERANLVKGFIEKRDKMVIKMKEIDERLKTSIAATLRPDQLEPFEKFWGARYAVVEAANRGPYDGLIRSATALKAATVRLGDLTPDQQSQIDAAFKTHQDVMRSSPKPNVEEQALRSLYTQVFAVFTDGQRKRVEQELTPKNAPKPGAATSAPAEAPAKTDPAAKAP